VPPVALLGFLGSRLERTAAVPGFGEQGREVPAFLPGRAGIDLPRVGSARYAACPDPSPDESPSCSSAQSAGP